MDNYNNGIMIRRTLMICYLVLNTGVFRNFLGYTQVTVISQATISQLEYQGPA